MPVGASLNVSGLPFIRKRAIFCWVLSFSFLALGAILNRFFPLMCAKEVKRVMGRKEFFGIGAMLFSVLLFMALIRSSL